MFKKTIDSTLAIDLSLEAVRVLDVRVRKSGNQEVALGSQAVAAGTTDTLPERHLAAIETLLNEKRIKTRHCVAAMPTALVVTRTIAVDTSKAQTSEEQIRAALQNCLPFDAKDLTFDSWIVGDSNANSRTRETLVVATQGSVVKRYLAGFEKLGITCEHLDVAPCAMASLIARVAGNPESMAGTVVIGATTGYFAIVEKERVLFWRPFDVPTAAQKVISAVQAGLDRVGDEISKCVSHMVGSIRFDNLSELLLYGHGSSDATFQDYLKNRFHLPVRSPSPFDSFPTNALSAELKATLDENASTHFAAAVGLAIQPAGASNNG